LPIARQIAAQHGGTLTVEDAAPGARFVLSLPAATAS
jgi:signal transduction histidine kinase